MVRRAGMRRVERNPVFIDCVYNLAAGDGLATVG